MLTTFVLWLTMLWSSPKPLLSLPPMAPPAMVHEEAMRLCPKSLHPRLLRDAPSACVISIIDERTRQLQRQLKRLQRQIQEQQ